jgi:hypothetical protein
MPNVDETTYDENEETYDPNDYGFIIGPDGELKSIMYPPDLMEDPPEEIKMILEIFGIDNFETLDHRVLH